MLRQGGAEWKAAALQVSLHNWREEVRLLHRLQGPQRQKVVLHQTSNSKQTIHTHIGGQGFWGFCEEDCLQNSTVATNDPNLGTWKPSGERGECGLTMQKAFRANVIEGVLDGCDWCVVTDAFIGGYDAYYGRFPFVALLGIELYKEPGKIG